MNSHHVVYKTNQPHEVLLVQNILKDLNIPHIGQEQSVTGMRTPMPPTPIPSAGTVWAILVPKVAINDAKQAIHSIGLEEQDENEIWSSSSVENHPTTKYVYIFILFVFFVSFVILLLSYLSLNDS